LSLRREVPRIWLVVGVRLRERARNRFQLSSHPARVTSARFRVAPQIARRCIDGTIPKFRYGLALFAIGTRMPPITTWPGEGAGTGQNCIIAACTVVHGSSAHGSRLGPVRVFRSLVTIRSAPKDRESAHRTSRATRLPPRLRIRMARFLYQSRFRNCARDPSYQDGEVSPWRRSFRALQQSPAVVKAHRPDIRRTSVDDQRARVHGRQHPNSVGGLAGRRPDRVASLARRHN